MTSVIAQSQLGQQTSIMEITLSEPTIWAGGSHGGDGYNKISFALSELAQELAGHK